MYIEEARKSVEKLDKILNELKVNFSNARREAIQMGDKPYGWNNLLDDVEVIRDIVADWEKII